MLPIPYRAKNPPESPPYITIGLIAVNVIIFLFTIDANFTVREGIAQNLGVSYDNANVFRFFTAMFLHANLLHIGGNMLFLWIFGSSVEGRLRHWKYLSLYLLSGIAGGLAQVYLFGRNEPDVVGYGASGAIMGVLGAYLYMFPFSRLCCIWWLLFRIRLFECQALWYIIPYMLLNVISIGSQDGVGHLAHLGGFALGYVGTMLLKPHTDSGKASEVKSMLSEVKDLHILTFYELQVLLAAPQTDSKILMAYCHRAMMDGGDKWAGMVVDAMRRHQNLVLDDADPREVSAFLLALGPNDPNLLPLVYLRIGSKLEQMSEHDLACHIYRRIYDMNPSCRDAETALFRMGRLLETAYGNPEEALKTYNEVLRLHPTGALQLDTQAAVARLAAKPKREVIDHYNYAPPNIRRLIEVDEQVPESASDQQVDVKRQPVPSPQQQRQVQEETIAPAHHQPVFER